MPTAKREKETPRKIFIIIQNFEALETAIKSGNILGKYDIDRIGVFGSFARWEAANDIDFYIDSDTCDLKRVVDLENLLI